MAQALLRFLAQQYVVMDGVEHLFVQGIFGIFGHGNVTGLGEALEYDSAGLKFYQGHNEQGMAHAATAFAKQKNRLGIFACTSSIGPGATNMITAAATATTNRIPLLLLPGDIFSCRQPDPVLQQLEVAMDYTMSVNDCFKPVSKYWDRIVRPEQLTSACLQAMRVLTDPAETGAVTLCLPQDVQCESYDYPESFFEKRLWHIDREPICTRALMEAVAAIQQATKPLMIAGGGVHYSFACSVLAEFALKHAIPVAETQAGKSALAASHSMNVGGLGVTGSEVANRLAAEADLLLVVGSRLQDFTTASKWAFKNKNLRIVHLNVSRVDAMKMNALIVKADAKLGLKQLSDALGEYQCSQAYQDQVRDLKAIWSEEVKAMCFVKTPNAKTLEQTAVLGLLNQWVDAEDVIIAAAGSLPGDLHRLWQCKRPKDYHLEYAFSCMGYEVAAGLGVRLAKGNNSGEVFVLVGDGSFLMLHSELVTCIQEHQKITILLFDNRGYQCIRNLQESQGSAGFGNEFRYRDASNQQLSGEYLAIDYVQYATALGAAGYYADSYDKLRSALQEAKGKSGVSVIVMPIAAKSMSHGYNTWWRVGVAEISNSVKVREAFVVMEQELKSICIE
ncbi:MAG: 3D-(3,5/4)-trihydroxycyclohexane-1,2-dione acylhydrolase (decyclizing) [Legionella sp.]|nr:MAG: 3D-(3,5/4)-trihydroxycyclohexane-1,2-dione acylhydrolase (decyclizing) [Legionella sp.]